MDLGGISPYKCLSNFVDLCVHHHSPWLFTRTMPYTLVDQVHLVFDGFTEEQKAAVKAALRVPPNADTGTGTDTNTDTIPVDRATYDLWKDDGFEFTWEPLWMHVENKGADRFEAYFRDAMGRYSCRRFVYDEGDVYTDFVEDAKAPNIIPWLSCQS